MAPKEDVRALLKRVVRITQLGDFVLDLNYELTRELFLSPTPAPRTFFSYEDHTSQQHSLGWFYTIDDALAFEKYFTDTPPPILGSYVAKADPLLRHLTDALHFTEYLLPKLRHRAQNTLSSFAQQMDTVGSRFHLSYAEANIIRNQKEHDEIDAVTERLSKLLVPPPSAQEHVSDEPSSLNNKLGDESCTDPYVDETFVVSDETEKKGVEPLAGASDLRKKMFMLHYDDEEAEQDAPSRKRAKHFGVERNPNPEEWIVDNNFYPEPLIAEDGLGGWNSW